MFRRPQLGVIICRVAPVVLLLLTVSLVWGQLPRQPGPTERGAGPARERSRGGMGGRGGGPGRNSAADRSEYLTWENPPQFAHDVFTFARIQYDSFGGRGGQQWSNDFPDCDWNFSVRLKELTSLNVHPNGAVLRLTDRELFEHPFIYMSNVQQMSLSHDEVLALRRYLLNGGFVMMDDFWAAAAWRHVRSVMKQVFPDRTPKELTIEHPLFHMVYDLKELPQVPSILAWRRGDRFEYWHGDTEGDEAPHFWGITDDGGRLMALMCHNNDIGDGWEREGEEIEYFKEYSERCSYPLGINILVYVMTH